MPKRYTLREALGLVGKRLSGAAWNGTEVDSREPPGPVILDDEWIPLRPDEKTRLSKPKQTATLERLREIRGASPGYADNERHSWQRREESRNKLREFVRGEDIKTWIVYFNGTRRDIKPEEWEAYSGPLWLNYSSSLGGYTEDNAGEVFIDRAALDTCLAKVPRSQGRTQTERRAATATRKLKLQQRADEIWRDKSTLTKRAVARQIATEPGAAIDHRQHDSRPLKVETIARLIHRPKTAASI